MKELESLLQHYAETERGLDELQKRANQVRRKLFRLDDQMDVERDKKYQIMHAIAEKAQAVYGTTHHVVRDNGAIGIVANADPTTIIVKTEWAKWGEFHAWFLLAQKLSKERLALIEETIALLDRISQYGCSIYERDDYLLCSPPLPGFPAYSENHDGDRIGALTRALTYVEVTMANFTTRSLAQDYPPSNGVTFGDVQPDKDWAR